MSWFTGVSIYICIWWVVIFAVLPFGVRAPDPDDPAAQVGAPARAMLWRKALATTIISAILWAGLDALILSGLFTFRE